jgi:hypothetical protein
MPARALDGLQVRLTLLGGRLLKDFRVSVEVPLLPGLRVTLLGETLREKSAAAVVKLDTLVHRSVSSLYYRRSSFEIVEAVWDGRLGIP